MSSSVSFSGYLCNPTSYQCFGTALYPATNYNLITGTLTGNPIYFNFNFSSEGGTIESSDSCLTTQDCYNDSSSYTTISGLVSVSYCGITTNCTTNGSSINCTTQKCYITNTTSTSSLTFVSSGAVCLQPLTSSACSGKYWSLLNINNTFTSYTQVTSSQTITCDTVVKTGTRESQTQSVVTTGINTTCVFESTNSVCTTDTTYLNTVTNFPSNTSDTYTKTCVTTTGEVYTSATSTINLSNAGSYTFINNNYNDITFGFALTFDTNTAGQPQMIPFDYSTEIQNNFSITQYLGYALYDEVPGSVTTSTKTSTTCTKKISTVCSTNSDSSVTCKTSISKVCVTSTSITSSTATSYVGVGAADAPIYASINYIPLNTTGSNIQFFQPLPSAISSTQSAQCGVQDQTITDIEIGIVVTFSTTPFLNVQTVSAAFTCSTYTNGCTAPTYNLCFYQDGNVSCLSYFPPYPTQLVASSNTNNAINFTIKSNGYNGPVEVPTIITTCTSCTGIPSTNCLESTNPYYVLCNTCSLGKSGSVCSSTTVVGTISNCNNYLYYSGETEYSAYLAQDYEFQFSTELNGETYYLVNSSECLVAPCLNTSSVGSYWTVTYVEDTLGSSAGFALAIANPTKSRDAEFLAVSYYNGIVTMSSGALYSGDFTSFLPQ